MGEGGGMQSMKGSTERARDATAAKVINEVPLITDCAHSAIGNATIMPLKVCNGQGGGSGRGVGGEETNLKRMKDARQQKEKEKKNNRHLKGGESILLVHNDRPD